MSTPQGEAIKSNTEMTSEDSFLATFKPAHWALRREMYTPKAPSGEEKIQNCVPLMISPPQPPLSSFLFLMRWAEASSPWWRFSRAVISVGIVEKKLKEEAGLVFLERLKTICSVLLTRHLGEQLTVHASCVVFREQKSLSEPYIHT